MNSTTYTSDNLFCSNSLPVLNSSVNFASQICHENINKPLDGAYLADFGIDISQTMSETKFKEKHVASIIHREKTQFSAKLRLLLK